jgi:hypothetical protein
MKIVLNETQYSKLITEDLGVSRASIIYSNLILQTLDPILKDKIDKGKNFADIIIIGLKDIKEIYQNNFDDFIELPIEEIIIEFTFKKVKNINKTDVKYLTGGAAYQIEKGRDARTKIQKPSLSLPKKVLEEIPETMTAYYEFGVIISQHYTNDDYSSLLLDLRDTIVHESNHILEFYKKRKVYNTALSFAGSKNKNIPKPIYDIWNEFLWFLYFSEPYEMNAMAQESYSKILRMTFDEFKKTKYWIYSEKMKNFDANKLYEELLRKINEYNPDTEKVFLNSILKWFKQDYISGSKDYGIEPNKDVVNSKDIITLMKKFEPRIKKSGDRLQKRFMRLYSLESV